MMDLTGFISSFDQYLRSCFGVQTRYLTRGCYKV